MHKHAAFATGIVLFASSICNAQGSPTEFEIGYTTGSLRAAIVLDGPVGLRSATRSSSETGDFLDVPTREVVGRVAWPRHTSTMVSFAWSASRGRDYESQRQTTSFPIVSYVEQLTTSYRNRALALSQTRDLPLSSVAVAFIGAGVELRSVSRTVHTTSKQTFPPTSAPLPAEATRSVDGSQRSLFASGGLRILVSTHATVFAEALHFLATSEEEKSLFVLEKRTDSLYGAIHWRWRIGAGVRF